MIHYEDMTKEQVIRILKDTLEYAEEKDKEIEKLNNKNEELLTLYTTEREVKDYYKNIINKLEHDFESYELEYLQETYQGSLVDFTETELERIKELKGSDKE